MTIIITDAEIHDLAPKHNIPLEQLILLLLKKKGAPISGFTVLRLNVDDYDFIVDYDTTKLQMSYSWASRKLINETISRVCS